jgi:hypothetical protein
MSARVLDKSGAMALALNGRDGSPSISKRKKI